MKFTNFCEISVICGSKIIIMLVSYRTFYMSYTL